MISSYLFYSINIFWASKKGQRPITACVNLVQLGYAYTKMAKNSHPDTVFFLLLNQIR